MDDKKDDNKEVEVVETEELEKALDEALEGLTKAEPDEEEPEMEEEPEPEEEPESEPAKKSKKACAKSEEEPDLELLGKSIPEIISEDEEAAEVMDAVPFVKALADAIEGQMTELVKAVDFLSDKIEKLEKSHKEQSKVTKAEAKLVKSISDRVGKLGNGMKPVKSFMGEKITILKKSDDGEKEVELSNVEALNGLGELCKSGKININELVKFESYINNGKQLPGNVMELLASTKK